MPHLFLHSQWEDDWNLTVEMMSTVLGMIWAFALNFTACELGQRVTSQYEVFACGLCACNWYFLAPEMQRVYLMFLLDAQMPIYILCYSGIECSRETFRKVAFEHFIL